MIVRRFAEPDLGQTRIPIVNLVSACPTYFRPLGILIISTDKYHKSTFSSRCMQCTVSFMCQPARLKLKCLLSHFGTKMSLLKCALLKHHSLLTVPHITLGSRLWINQYSSSITVCFMLHDSNHNVGKGPYVHKQTYLAFTSISRLLFNAVVYMASLSLRQEVMTRQCMT